MTGTLVETSDGTPFFPPNTTPAGVSQGPSAAITGIMSILTALNSQSVQWAVQSGISDLKPTLDSSISSWADNNTTGKCYDPASVGCIIEVATYSESGPIGTPATYGYIGVYEGSCGLDFQTALNDTVSSGGVYPSPPDGGTLTLMYLWYQQE
jgi:hypothetical protein